jgi:hypothetical protein
VGGEGRGAEITMKPVMQTICNNKNGDCFRACIASMLEVEIEKVINFMEDGADYFYEKCLKFCDDTGLLIVDFPIGQCDDELKRGAMKDLKGRFLCATIPSPRYKDTDHTVIVKDGFVIHDPYPGGITGYKPDIKTITFIAISDIEGFMKWKGC